MTKTGFYYGDPYKQLNKNFTYHGINSKCVKPPKPEPYYSKPTGPTGAVWELLYFIDEVSWYVIKKAIIWEDFLPTDRIDPCYQKAPDGLQRVYMFDAHIYRDPEFEWQQFNWCDGMVCVMDGELTGDNYNHIATATYLTGGDNPYELGLLLYGNPVGEGSWVSVWRSSTGEIPTGAYPVTLTRPAPWDLV
jgi:hypothetical protein